MHVEHTNKMPFPLLSLKAFFTLAEDKRAAGRWRGGGDEYHQMENVSFTFIAVWEEKNLRSAFNLNWLTMFYCGFILFSTLATLEQLRRILLPFICFLFGEGLPRSWELNAARFGLFCTTECIFHSRIAVYVRTESRWLTARNENIPGSLICCRLKAI